MDTCKVVDEETKYCTDCGERKFWNGTACTACPEDLPNWDQERRACVAECLQPTPHFNGTTCISCAEYSREVGRNLSYWTEGKCSDVYPVLTPVKVDDEYRSCEDRNPAEPLWTGYTCSSCYDPYGGRYFDGNWCVEKCPETFVDIWVGSNYVYRCKTC